MDQSQDDAPHSTWVNIGWQAYMGYSPDDTSKPRVAFELVDYLVTELTSC